MPVEKKQANKPTMYPYFNRELSWLAFNRRVLDQACDASNPLLERLKFLSIVSSNLDEFYEIRVSGFLQQVESGVREKGMDGILPREQIRRINDVVTSLVEEQYRCWHEQLVPAMHAEDIHFSSVEDLSPTEKKWAENYFREQVFPILTPLAIDPAHPFPQIGNKTLNILVSLQDTEAPKADPLMAILPVPRILPRVVQIDPGQSANRRFIFLSDMIKIGARRLFPGYRILSSQAFRITRNSDLYFDEEESENLLTKIEEELHKRQKGAAVRLEIEDGVEDDFIHRLLRYIDLSQEYVFRINGPLNLLRLMSVYGMIDRPDLKDKPLVSHLPPALADPEQLFATIKSKDQLVHHPYDSFQPIISFIEQAARDPSVFAIKQTLYRTSGDSPIIDALITACENGKQVTALVELKARFDEANNIIWAKRLEEAGVHVVYGMINHKIHCKCSLVVRREKEQLRHYAHLGTGNYNPSTARLYTDLGLFTADEEITREVAALFNTLTGFGKRPNFRNLAVAPFNLHEKMEEHIRREITLARKGRPAYIFIKINSLVDQAIIDLLYEASTAGVRIDLVVRGICCLVPGVAGISETITVRSIVGRFLEHSRFFYFQNHGGKPRYFMGSADWMPRNFYRRVESVFPVKDPDLQNRLYQEIIEASLQDNTKARLLQRDGSYRPLGTSPPYNSQEALLAAAGKKESAGAKGKAVP
ncbi:MAG: polyphosphate kinase 1 [Opitutales bacterium]|nr:polyphosphate kinase 1 [Opitutales bacterium]MCH8539840.1 polyphosphate kinase 1 [Opitutales bacterium]